MKRNRRKLACLALGAVTAMLMSGCGEASIHGEVIEVETQAQSRDMRIVVAQDDGGTVTVSTNDNTLIFSWLDEVTTADLREGTMDGIMVSAEGRKTREGLTASHVVIDELRIPGGYTLDDGTQLDLRQGYRQHSYYLPDGTELLCVSTPVGPENVTVLGTEVLGSLSEEAQEKILSYYRDQGILYDEFQVLEDAYDAWYILGGEFSTYSLSQEISPTASNDELIYFLTVATIPDGGPNSYTELRLGGAFRKDTGEPVSQSELFTCAEDEIIRKVAELCRVDDEELIAAMEDSFRPEYLVFFPDNLEIRFPAGTLPGYDTSFSMGLDYSGDVCALLHGWAVPKYDEN